MTRRRLLEIAAAGVVSAVAVQGCGDALPDPKPLDVAPGAARAYARGINVYTVNYTGNGGRIAGEPAASYTYLADRGHRLLRLPFEWGFVQPALGGELDAGFLAVLDRQIAAAAGAGMLVVLDVHSGGRYPTHLDEGRRFGDGISEEQFVDLWLRLSARYGGDPRIYAYDLMNEPTQLPDDVWPRFSQAAVQALRARGDRTLLWIQGSDYSLTGSWRAHHPRPWIDDPLDRHAYSAHAYAGEAARRAQRAPREPDQMAFLRDLRDFLDWLSQFRRRGSIGEVGWPSAREVGDDGAAAWNRLGDAWYAMADASRVDVTYFGASSAYDNWLWAYDAARNDESIPGLRQAESQAEVLEAHGSRADLPRPRSALPATTTDAG